MSRLLAPVGAQLDVDMGDWTAVLGAWRASPAGQTTLATVDARLAAGATVYPAQVFRALSLTPLASARVVILGQDPYHGAGQAEGLAFSVPANQRVPPSLRNIFKELQRDLGLVAPTQGSLLTWAAQGVLLLNTTLTVEDSQPGSHAKLGWHVLTDAICELLLADPEPKVFMLWGAHAQARVPVSAPATPHLILRSNHPSPLAAQRPPVPFLGCGHFGLANQFLAFRGRGAINWKLT